MLHKLTINVSDEVYEGLHRVVGRGRISKFLENLARPHVTQGKLEARDVAGCVPYKGKPATDEDFRQAMLRASMKKWAKRLK